VTWHFLKDPKISGQALYYLASAKELSHVSGRFFNLTIEEKPAALHWIARIKERYEYQCRNDRFSEKDVGFMKYDAFIVGGGIAGLTCAAFLSKSGYKVLLCEKQNHIGA
jgi:hypothetical protein